MPTTYDRNERRRNEWSGYSLDELRYRRAVMSVKLEIEKERLSEIYQTTVGKVFNPGRMESGIMSHINNFFSFVDYGAMAYNLIKKMINIYKNIKN